MAHLDGARALGDPAPVPRPAPRCPPRPRRPVDDAAQRIADLTEARRILLAVMSRPSLDEAGRRAAVPGGGELVDPPARWWPSRRPSRPCRSPGRDFPYRREGRKAPDRPPKLLACVVEEAGVAGGRGRCRTRSAGARRPIDGRAHLLDRGGRRPARGRPRADLLSAAPARQAGQPADRALPPAHRAVPVHLGHEGHLRHPRRARGTTPKAIPGPVTHEWVEGKGHDLQGARRPVPGRHDQRVGSTPAAEAERHRVLGVEVLELTFAVSG